MLNIVKERLFGSFMADDTKLSLESAYNIDAIYRDMLLEKGGRSRVSFKSKDRSRHTLNPNTSTLYGSSPRATLQPSATPGCGRLHRTIDYSLHTPQASLQTSRRASMEQPQMMDISPRVLLPRKRINSQRLPSIQQINQGRNELMNPRAQ